jgi:photosystem II stability/assembly factor-like uncharacterized protein
MCFISWDTLIRGITVRDIDIHPSKSNIVYITGGINYLTPHGILKTLDGGMNWFQADTNLNLFPEEGPSVLAIDPLYPDTLYMGTGGVFGGKLYKSTDGGQTWEAIGADVYYLIDGVTAIAIDPSNTDIIYVGTPGIFDIFKIKDGGKNWERLDFPEVGIIYDLLVHPTQSNIIYAGTWFYGFFFSTDGGTSWQKVNAGLPDTSWVNKIVIAQGKVSIAANGGGYGSVYESSQDSYDWIKVGTVGFEPVIYTTNLSVKNNQIFAGAFGIYVLADHINHKNSP